MGGSVFYTFNGSDESIEVEGADASSFEVFCLPDDALLGGLNSQYARDRHGSYLWASRINEHNQSILEATATDPLHLRFVAGSGSSAINYFKDLHKYFIVQMQASYPSAHLYLVLMPPLSHQAQGCCHMLKTNYIFTKAAKKSTLLILTHSSHSVACHTMQRIRISLTLLMTTLS